MSTSIYVVRKSQLYTIVVILVCILLFWMTRSSEPKNHTTETTPPPERAHQTSSIPTVGTSGMWIHMILDESGSMHSVRDSTIDALNQYMNKQKLEINQGGDNHVDVSLMKFNGYQTPIVYDRISLLNVPALTHSTYQPSGGTNLYDAIGRTIERIDQQLLQSSSIHQRPAVLVVILTDGEENQSQSFSRHMIQSMITQRRDAGWKFIFLGANIEAGNVAETIGIARNAAIKIDVADTSYSEALDQSTSSWRKSAAKVQAYASSNSASVSASSYAAMMDSVDADFSDEVRQQYERP